jgi:hypothetical protein
LERETGSDEDSDDSYIPSSQVNKLHLPAYGNKCLGKVLEFDKMTNALFFVQSRSV